MQCTSPGMMSSEASESASKEPNRLVTPCSASSGPARDMGEIGHDGLIKSRIVDRGD